MIFKLNSTFYFQNLISKIYLMIINDDNNDIKNMFLDIKVTKYINFKGNFHQMIKILLFHFVLY